MIKLYAINCGWLTGPAGFFLAGQTGRLRVPVPAFLIDHPKGKALFDTGLNLRFKQRVEQRGSAAGFEAELTAAEEIGARLRQMGVDPGEIRWVALSHLHLDHCAGLALVPNATVVVQRAEYLMAHSGDGGPEYDRSYFDLGHPVRQIEGEFDLYGDGSFVLFPTPGHSAGHQSARVRIAGKDVILAGDCCYLRSTLNELTLPSHSHDGEAHLASILRLRGLRDAGARIVFGHDPEQWAELPQAPIRLA
jgi:glyoxylase-like metal-dependent hydrolase (beta-lactamase superfamily II)